LDLLFSAHREGIFHAMCLAFLFWLHFFLEDNACAFEVEVVCRYQTKQNVARVCLGAIKVSTKNSES
jgi:hypothetical protein